MASDTVLGLTPYRRSVNSLEVVSVKLVLVDVGALYMKHLSCFWRKSDFFKVVKFTFFLYRRLLRPF